MKLVRHNISILFEDGILLSLCFIEVSGGCEFIKKVIKALRKGSHPADFIKRMQVGEDFFYAIFSYKIFDNSVT